MPQLEEVGVLSRGPAAVKQGMELAEDQGVVMLGVICRQKRRASVVAALKDMAFAGIEATTKDPRDQFRNPNPPLRSCRTRPPLPHVLLPVRCFLTISPAQGYLLHQSPSPPRALASFQRCSTIATRLIELGVHILGVPLRAAVVLRASLSTPSRLAPVGTLARRAPTPDCTYPSPQSSKHHLVTGAYRQSSNTTTECCLLRLTSNRPVSPATCVVRTAL
jgi:hypothetical protein